MKTASLLSLALALTACDDASSKARPSASAQPPLTGASYTPPQTRPGPDGWREYVEPKLYSAEDASTLDIMAATPEAVVLLYLAGLTKGKPPKQLLSTDCSNCESALKKHAQWKVLKFKLVKKKLAGPKLYWIEFWATIEAGGETQRDTDGFTVRSDNGAWRISKLPM